MARSGSGLRGGLSFHLYAIVEALPPWWRPSPQGVDGRSVLARQMDTFTVVASPLALPLIRTPATLAQHREVLAGLLEARSMLPLPFGPALPEAELACWLEERRGRIEAALSELRGSVEMTVRLVRLEASAPGTSAAAFLKTFAERLVERAALDRWRYLPCGSGVNLGGTLAFLVLRAAVPEFLARIAPLASRAAGLAVVPSGPWPPWSFAPALEVGSRREIASRLPVARAG